MKKITCLLLLFTAGLAFGQTPANDDPDNALALAVGTAFTDFPLVGDNTGATDSAETNPSCAFYQGGDTWYSLVVPPSGEVIIETNRVAGSNVTDSGMSVYEGAIGALTEIECDDDGSDDGLFSLIELTGQTPGATLYISVWEFGNNAFGEFQVAVYDITCDAPLDLGAGNIVAGSVDISWTASGTATSYNWEIQGVGVAQGDPAAIASGNTTMTTETVMEAFVIGDSYTLYVQSDCGAGGTSIYLSIEFDFILPPANDDPDNALALTVGTAFSDFPLVGNNTGATDSAETNPSCAFYQGGDTWYSFVVPASGEVIVETNRVVGSDVTDSGMSVYEGAIGALTQIECDDDDSDDGNFSLISLTGQTPGVTLYVSVWGFGNNAFGEFQVAVYDITCDAPLDLAAGNFVAGSVDISWTASGTATSYNWEIQEVGVVQGDPAAIASGNTTMTLETVMEAFVIGDSYTLYVQSDCGAGGTSIYLSIDFDFVLPPANDAPVNALALTVGTAFSDFPLVGTNTGATDSAETNPSCAFYQGGDTWYSFVVPASGEVIVETNRVVGSDVNDSGMSVYEGTIGALTEIECDDDDSDDGLFSLIVLTGQTPGATLYVSVWEFGNNAFGEFQVAVYDITCSVPADLVADNFVAGSVDVSWTTSGTVTSYNWEIQEVGVAQGDPGAVASGTTAMTMETATGAFVNGNSYTLYVQSDCGTVGTSVYISIDFDFIFIPANDDPDNAVALTVGTSFTEFPVVGNNAGATGSAETAASCASYQGGDVWYSVVVPASGNVTLETNAAAGSDVNDSGMSVYEGTIGALTEIECDDDDSDDGLFSLIVLTGQTPGETLYVRVWEFGNNAFGEFQVAAYNLLPCEAPTDLVADNFGPNSVDISWTAAAAAVSYNWEIQNGGTPQGDPSAIALGNNVTGTSDTTSGIYLEGNTYTLFVQSVCIGNETSEFVSIDFVYSLLGVNDSILDGFSAYPNPAENILNIASSVHRLERVVIYNMLGQEVLDQNMNANNAQLDVSDFASGTYLMRISINGIEGNFRFLKK
ncbi:T9SS type A sorting domain-containing protein [Patiriisocius sp. Uisw_017]|uniref:T9SS type A sorting domain-containing protein n=1 Tax=Patiriisocius sp. Uisw_017 TaxID=3230968 RepID=UPI0039E86586